MARKYGDSDNPVHLRDDIHIIKAKTARAVRRSRELLVPALSANGKNKPHVVKDHIERIYSILIKLDEDLRSQDPNYKPYPRTP